MTADSKTAENEGDGRKKWFGRFTGFFKNLFKSRKSAGRDHEAYSKFKHFFEKIGPGDPMYPSVRQAATLCDDALRTAKQRIRLSERIHRLNEQMAELESFSRLTEEEIHQLKLLLDHFVSLTSERSMLLNQLSDFDKSLVEMFKLEEDAVLAIPQIHESEKYQRALRQDLSYLHGEKEDLVFEREDMNKTLLYMHRFSIGLLVLFLLVITLLAFLYIFNDQNIFLPTAILVLLVIGLVTLLSMFRQRLRAGLRLNLRKQHRAVELLNKKNILFAYYTNYLRFSYKKYKVKNARMLESNLKDFGNYKFLINRIDTIRNLMYETEDNIERFLREKKLTGVKATIEGFARTVNLEDKKRYYNEILAERQGAEKELSALEERTTEIWETLMVLNDRDHSHNHIIEEIISTYLNEAGQLFAVLGGENDKPKPAPDPAPYKPGGIDRLSGMDAPPPPREEEVYVELGESGFFGLDEDDEDGEEDTIYAAR